ncbi:hypothetical protein Dda_0168 [Drechslerella dactyloides]|uniref:Subtelomeric hrmA-associated cluster protein AFUB-079030/YDR124W-like helical bundle domain-containing protein n=1 Tax=Drechslerella dactyloides TaxID=74499 RepID=A0AAD6J3V0_DREDA|nr:hypothetical protein Dda_0168 [Drechslerella dactyloides]
MVQPSSERDIFNLKTAQVLSSLRKDFPLGTQLALFAVSPDGRSSIHCSDQLKPYEESLYNDDVKKAAITAITVNRKRPFQNVALQLPQSSGSKNVPTPASPVVHPGDEEMTIDEIASSAVRPRKKPRRAISEPTPLPQLVNNAASSSSSSSSSSFSTVITGEPEVGMTGQQAALPPLLLPPPPPGALEQLPIDESQRLDKGKGKAVAADLGNDNPAERRIDEEGEEGEERSIALRIGDTQAVTNYLISRFVQIQQLDCRALAKSWIKAVEPKKQSHSPYNKGDLTRPYWWPMHVPHREPDHLLRSHRVDVLVAILRRTGMPLAELRSATNSSRGVRPRQKELLSEVCDVVGLERRYLSGQLDQDHIVYVVPFTKLTKRKPRASKAAAAGKPAKQPRQQKRGAATTRRRRAVPGPTAATDPSAPLAPKMEDVEGDNLLGATASGSAQPEQMEIIASSSRTSVPKKQSAIKRRQSADVNISIDQAIERPSPAVSEPRGTFEWAHSPGSTVSAAGFAMSHTQSPGTMSTLPAPPAEPPAFTMGVSNPSMYTPLLSAQMPPDDVSELHMLPPNDSGMAFPDSTLGMPSGFPSTDAYLRFALDEGGSFTSYQNFDGYPTMQ